ncbi:uncharacterized protein [Chironomus tepperi]|uniref:uncharacterized protein isoform X2 n=1 Tax=Chironomus tepperi TaxID=113505 RepID=UPI00391F6F1F
MKYLFVLVLLVPIILADEEIQIKNEEPKIAAANFYPINMISRMRYSMGNGMIPPPPQAIQHYSLMKDEDFPVDYSQSCSNSCNCRTVCVMYWWVPCTCACPPPCSNNNNNQNIQNNNRFPPIEWEPETQPPRFPNFPRLTTTTTTPEPPARNTRPNWNPMPPRWPTPEWSDPHNPNNHPTHPPIVQQPNNPQPGPQPISPPIWIDRNPNPWNPSNPNGFPTHPPQTTPPSIWWNQRPGNPVPEPIPNPPNWWDQLPQQPVQPNPPNWWEQQPQQPVQPNPPNWWDQQPQEPVQPNPPNWWDQQPQQPVQPNPPNWWDQQPQQPVQPNPPNWWEQPPQIEQPCDNSCSCVPCTVIWVCPPTCSASCCASRGFGNAETVDKVEVKAEIQQAAEPQSIVEPFINYPDYLKDIFVPGEI